MGKTGDILTNKQELFCHEYLKDLNATQACIRAKYSEKNADKIGPELLGNPRVANRVQQLMDRRLKRAEVKANDILDELTRLGYADVRGLFDSDGCVLPMSKWPDDLARAVANIEVKEEYIPLPGAGIMCSECTKSINKQLIGFVKKIKFWDKPKALELMGRHKKLFTDHVEHSGKIDHKHTSNLTEAEIDARIAEKLSND